jgi:hypothetical protein
VLPPIQAISPGFTLRVPNPESRQPESDLAQLAVADNVDARVGLFADGLRDPGLHAGHDRGQVGAATGHEAESHFPQVPRTIQASCVRGENSIGAVFHQLYNKPSFSAVAMAPV